MLGAALIHPDMRAVIPLMPEPIVRHDGTSKNDCERNAAQRCVAKRRQDHPHLQCIVTEDSLSANAPHIETLQHDALSYLLGGKEGDQAFLCQQVQVAEHAGRVTSDERHDRAAGLGHRFRCVHDVPLKASPADLRVNFIAYWEVGDNKVQPCSWVTDLRVNKRTVYALMRGGRARWKIANETFNTLQNHGYHFEHHDGHGTQNLSVVLARLMMLAFLVDQTQQLCWALFRAVWAKLGSKRLLWERIRSLVYTSHLDSMRELLIALLHGVEKTRPILLLNTSSSLPLFSRTGWRRRRSPIGTDIVYPDDARHGLFM